MASGGRQARHIPPFGEQDTYLAPSLIGMMPPKSPGPQLKGHVVVGGRRSTEIIQQTQKHLEPFVQI